MLKFFGISKKDKISVEDTANIFSVALNKVVNVAKFGPEAIAIVFLSSTMYTS